MNRLVVTLSFFASACGGERGGPPPETAHEVSDPYADPEPTASPTGEPAPQATAASESEPPGAADVMVKILVGADESGGRVRILAEGGRVVAEGDAPFTAHIPAGTYTITGQPADGSLVVDRPTATMEGVVVRPGGPHPINVQVPLARVRLRVLQRGREVRNPEITLFHAGSTEPAHRYRPNSQYLSISPGRYEADVKIGSQTTHVSGFTFMEGATQDIPIELH